MGNVVETTSLSRSTVEMREHNLVFPPNVLLLIISKLEMREVVALSRVCKTWMRISRHDSIWKHFIPDKVAVEQHFHEYYVEHYAYFHSEGGVLSSFLGPSILYQKVACARGPRQGDWWERLSDLHMYPNSSTWKAWHACGGYDRGFGYGFTLPRCEETFCGLRTSTTLWGTYASSKDGRRFKFRVTDAKSKSKGSKGMLDIIGTRRYSPNNWFASIDQELTLTGEVDEQDYLTVNGKVIYLSSDQGQTQDWDIGHIVECRMLIRGKQG